MKILFENYSFNASAKTVTFNTTDIITLEQLLIITNVTTNKIIYNFADPNAGGSIINNILTLDLDTTSMSSSDKLQIFIDNTSTPASDETLQFLSDQTALLGRVVKLLEPSSNQNAVGQQRIEVVTAPQTIVNHNLTYMGGANATITPAEHYFVLGAKQAYISLRQNLIFS